MFLDVSNSSSDVETCLEKFFTSFNPHITIGSNDDNNGAEGNGGISDAHAEFEKGSNGE
jgi:hypothetical protein